MSRVRKLALSALLVALSTALLYGASLLPAAQLAVIAAAGLLPAVAVIHCGLGWSAGVYAASSILALLLLPDKLAALWYLLVFGHYGILKSLIERLKRPAVQWGLKLAVFAAVMGLMYLLFRSQFLAALPEYSVWILFAALLVCFVLYDIAFSALISVYNRRIAPHINRS